VAIPADEYLTGFMADRDFNEVDVRRMLSELRRVAWTVS